MTDRLGRKKALGFTLIELMIVITLIGILSAVAIPAFRQYQMKSKRAEAYTNLVALSKAQKSYYAEWSTYISVLGQPITATSVAPSSNHLTISLPCPPIATSRCWPSLPANNPSIPVS